MNTDAYLSIFFRLMPILVVFPVPGLDRIPATLRLFFCLGLTICIATGVPAPRGEYGPGSIVIDFLFGTALALGVHATFAGFHLGGTLVDTQAGTSASSLFNPAHGSSGVFAEILTMGVAISVLLSDAMLMLVARTISLSPAPFPGDADLLLARFAENLAAGFLITLPVVAGLWLVDVLATASARLLPQANVYFLFLPVKVLFATLLFAASASLMLAVANHLVLDALSAW